MKQIKNMLNTDSLKTLLLPLFSYILNVANWHGEMQQNLFWSVLLCYKNEQLESYVKYSITATLNHFLDNFRYGKLRINFNMKLLFPWINICRTNYGNSYHVSALQFSCIAWFELNKIYLIWTIQYFRTCATAPLYQLITRITMSVLPFFTENIGQAMAWLALPLPTALHLKAQKFCFAQASCLSRHILVWHTAGS